MKKSIALFENVNHRRVANPILLRILRVSMLACGGLILMTTLLLLIVPTFKITKIKVVGNEFYSEEQIIKRSELKIGQELFGIDLDAVCDKIYADPYIKAVTVESAFPCTVKITVTEAKNLFYSSSDGLFFSFDDNLKALKVSRSETDFQDFIKVELPTVKEVKAGKRIEFLSSGIDDMKTVIAELDRQKILPKVSGIDFSDMNNIKYDLNRKCRILLGTPTSLPEKIALAEETVNAGSVPENCSLDVRDPARTICRENDVVF